MNKMVSIAFFGSSQNSLIVLKELLNGKFEIKLVVTAPPRLVGRKKILTKTPVHTYAEKNKIPVKTPEKLDENIFSLSPKPCLLNPDLCIVADYARLIPSKLLKIPKHGFINLHPSLLPKYRGSTPAQAAILNGDQQTGLTIFKIVEKLDAGPIISWFIEEIVQPDPDKNIKGDTQESLYQRLFTIGSQVLVTILPALLEGRITPRQQEHDRATYAYRLTRDHGYIPWPTLQKAINGKKIEPNDLNEKLIAYLKNIKFKLPTTNYQLLDRAIRAFYPWPGIWTTVSTEKGDKRLKILSSSIKNKKLILEKVQLEGCKLAQFSSLIALLG